MTKINNTIGHTWEEARETLFTREEIAASDLRVAIIGELVKARDEQGITQKQLEQSSGVSQPVIARMESGRTNPQIETVLKLLYPLGKTLKVVSLNDNQ